MKIFNTLFKSEGGNKSNDKKHRVVVVVCVVLALLVIVSTIYYFLNYGDRSKNWGMAPIDKASKLINEGEKEKAITVLERVNRSNDFDEGSATLLASLYFQVKDYDKFVSFVKEKELASAMILNMLAGTAMAKGEMNEAEEYYKEAIQKEPLNIKTYINMASYYQSRGDLESAFTIINSGLQKKPDSINLNLCAASIAIKKGDTKSAKKFAQKILEIDNKHIQAKAILDQLN